MILTSKNFLALIVVAALIAIGSTRKTAIAGAQAANTPSQAASPNAPASAPAPEYVAAGTAEAIKLLRLMDADKSGKVSRAEFMAFMTAEFDRMDINHDGELDLKELDRKSVV